MVTQELYNMQIFGSVIAAIATLVAAIVAVAVVCISYQQHQLSKDKFRLYLFEKRFSVYKGVQRFLTEILKSAKVEMDKFWEFRRDTQDAIFLFSDDIPKYLATIDRKALDMRSKVEEYRDLPKGQERSRLCREEAQLLRELTEELPHLKDVFAPYLKFDKWK